MIRLSGYFQRLTLDVGRYTKTLDQAMDIQLRQIARAWLRAVIVKVPVWTGMSRGSLQPLGAFLRVKVPVSPVVTRSGMGPSAGAALSSFSFTKEGYSYSFEFDEGVPHYIINEFYNVKPPINLITPGPYGSFKAGDDAANAYIANLLPERLPRVEDVVVSREVRFVSN